jgi:hypothetical protein
MDCIIIEEKVADKLELIKHRHNVLEGVKLFKVNNGELIEIK